MSSGGNFGKFSYPGVVAYESFSITDVSGITPSRGVLEMYPQYGIPDVNGDIVLTYNQYQITFPNCRLDSFSYQRNSGGKIVTVSFLDERWSWKYANITGRYNIRFPDNFVDPAHERDPQTLVSMCFDALGVQAYDVSQLPNDARPDIDWDHANPAEEMAKICDDLGCRIVPIRSTGVWTICVTGVGANLPETFPFNDAGDGIDPKEIPDFIKIVSAPVRFQMAVRLSPVAKDTDLAWVELDELSYSNNGRGPGTQYYVPPAWGFNQGMFGGFQSIDANRRTLADGTLKSPRELAVETIFKAFRIYDPQPYGKFTTQGSTPKTGQSSKTPKPNQASILVPGYGKVFRKQMILSNELVTSYTDPYGELHKRSAFVFGQFRGQKAQRPSNNYPFGTRIDAQVRNSLQISKEEQRSFNLQCNPIDSDRTIITFSDIMIYRPVPNSPGYNVADYPYQPARLWLMCAVQIRDLVTWQPVRNEYYYPLGGGGDRDFCLEVVKNDILPWYITSYPLKPDIYRYDQDLTVGKTTNNADEVERQSLYYAQQISQQFITQSTGSRTYYGLFPIDMDGAIQQVSYRLGKQGYDTIASVNTEHDFDIPPYAERRQRDGRRNIDQRLNLIKELMSQRGAMARGGISTGFTGFPE